MGEGLGVRVNSSSRTRASFSPAGNSGVTLNGGNGSLLMLDGVLIFSGAGYKLSLDGSFAFHTFEYGV
jgi:hypothetical protein